MESKSVLDFDVFLKRMTDKSFGVPETCALPVAKPSVVDVVLLTCMDYRYPHRIIDAMDQSPFRGRYDHLILAGAGLGVVHAAAWRETIFEELRFAIDEHGAMQVLIMEHRDCGAYRKFLGVDASDPAKEMQSHIDQSKTAAKAIIGEFPILAGHVHCVLLPIEKVDDLGTY